MLHLNRRSTAAAGVAFVVLVGMGCSESTESPDVSPSAEAEARVEEATAGEEGGTVSAEAQARVEAYTADVVASIKRAGDFLAAQESVSFQADIAYDVLQANGQMLEFGATRDYLMRRPDRLRIEAITRDGEVMQLFFDGQSILVDMPNEDAYIQIEKPGTFYAATRYLVDELGAPGPLNEFISENFAPGVEEQIESGFYVQRVLLDGQICEHLAWRSAKVDVELWVREGEEPVPCRVVITYRNAEGRPRFAADFHDWNFSPEVDDELFSFIPPESAERLQAQVVIREQSEALGVQ